jgi:3-oxoacyl-[acyl-carrier-protein] synthase II
MKRRVAVTGMGVVSPLGSSVSLFRDRLLAGDSGVGRITQFDPGALPTRIAAEVKETFDAELRDRKIAFALEAARQAMADAGHPEKARGGMEAGVSVGVGLELFSMEDLVAMQEPGFALPADPMRRLSFLQTPSDVCVHLLSHRYGLRAPPLVHVSACAAGADAIGAAYRLVASGRRRWMLAGGTDSMVNPLGLGGFCKLGATSPSNDPPERASRPFDRARNGFVLGEGAGMMVLEPVEEAQARGATIHAEVMGYGCSFDAYGISEPHPEGRGAYQAMARALEDAGIGAEAIDCVSAHGTSTPKNDIVETMALKRLLGERAYRVPISAAKSMIGHLISAAGAVESIAAIACMEVGRVHPTVNLEDPDPLCDLDCVPLRARAHDAEIVLKCSFAFGGQNAALVLRNGRTVRA